MRIKLPLSELSHKDMFFAFGSFFIKGLPINGNSFHCKAVSKSLKALNFEKDVPVIRLTIMEQDVITNLYKYE